MTLKATRVKKARTNSGTCQLCRGPLLVGQQLGLYPPIRTWLHTACAGRRCEHCHQRLPLVRIAQGFTAHPMCGGDAE